MTAATVAATYQHTALLDVLEQAAPQTNLPIEDFVVRAVITSTVNTLISDF